MKRGKREETLSLGRRIALFPFSSRTISALCVSYVSLDGLMECNHVGQEGSRDHVQILYREELLLLDGFHEFVL